MKTIASAVGRQSLNAAADQQTVLALLNRVPPHDGGPPRPLTEPVRAGAVGPALLAAIVAFQNKNADPPHRDGRVDPGGQTLRLLNALAGEGPLRPHLPGGPHGGGVLDVDVSTRSIDVRGGLVPLKQPLTSGCWATSATMLWKLKNPGRINDRLPALDQVKAYLASARNPAWTARFNANQGLNPLEFPLFFERELGLVPLAIEQPLIASGKASVLFWLAQLSRTRRPHLINTARLEWTGANAHTSLLVGASLDEAVANEFAGPSAAGPSGVVTLLDPGIGRFRRLSGADIDYLLGPPGGGTLYDPTPESAGRMRSYRLP